MRRSPVHAHGAIFLFVAIILTLSMAACSDDTPTGANTDPSTQGEIDPQGEPTFMLGSTTVDGMTDGRIDVWAHNLEVGRDSTGSYVSFDVVLHNRSRTDVYAPIWFFIMKITPDDVYVLNSDIVYITEGPPGFDFSDELGGDDKLAAGEQSGPRTVRFGMRELQSFSIGFRITVGTPPDRSLVSGTVFHDANQNGTRDEGERGIPGLELTLTGEQEGDSTFLFPEVLRTATTDADGHYGFDGSLIVGIYELRLIVPPRAETTTPNPLIVTLVADTSGIIPLRNVDFGVFSEDPPEIEPLFGPIPVGPGSFIGPRFEGGFWLRAGQPTRGYVLDAMLPPILDATGGPLPMRIDRARVWINEEEIYHFMCGDSIPPDVCFPSPRAEIPPGVIQHGRNSVKIAVDGSEYSFMIFTIFHGSQIEPR